MYEIIASNKEKMIDVLSYTELSRVFNILLRIIMCQTHIFLYFYNGLKVGLYLHFINKNTEFQ